MSHLFNKPTILQNIGLFFGDLWMAMPVLAVSKIKDLNENFKLVLAIAAMIIFVRACRKAYQRASA